MIAAMYGRGLLDRTVVMGTLEKKRKMNLKIGKKAKELLKNDS